MTDPENSSGSRSPSRPPKPPSLPDGVERECDAPDGWRGGRAEHTGGNIWCRTFRKDRPSVVVEVQYEVADYNGVGLNVRGKGDADFLDPIDVRAVDELTEEDALSVAQEIMAEVDAGDWDDEIQAAVERHEQ